MIYLFSDKVPLQRSISLSGNRYTSMALNYDTRDKGVVVMISWVDNLQLRFELDTEMKSILLQHGYNPETYYFGVVFMWPTEADLLFTVMADFRASLLYQLSQKDNTTSCHLAAKACVKMPDMFNLVQDTMQHLYNIYTAFVPVLLAIFPQNKVLHTLNTYPVLFSVVLPTIICLFFLLFTLPLCCLAKQFVRRNRSRKTEIKDVDSAASSLLFRDFCDCSEARISVPRTETRKQKKFKKENFQVILNWSLGIFLFIMIFIYPFSIKLTKTLVQTKFQAAISNYNTDVSSWLVVVFKYLSIFFFENKFGHSSACSLISNPFMSGFWNIQSSNNTDYGDKFLVQLFKEQKEKFAFFGAKLATASLTVSFSTLFHFITIYLMLQMNIFKKISEDWSTGLMRKKVGILMLIMVCLVINISRYFMCLDNSDIWISFIQRLVMMSVCTPSSIVLEWVCLRVYYSYIAILQNHILQLLSCGRNNKENILSTYLARGYLTVAELRQWKISVSRYTTAIQSLLEHETGHKFLAIDTGSIVERFGLPLASRRKGLKYLKTDHDVMFVPTNTIVSLQRGSIKLVNIDGLEEYFHLFSFNRKCRFLSLLLDNEGYIDNTKDKVLMQTVVGNMPMKELEPKNDDTRTLLGLACINLSQRILQWDKVHAAITGPALNFKVTTAHLNHSLTKHAEWQKRMDCDFILAFHLDYWPQVASEWITRPRKWPRQETISKIVTTGCEVVPKIRSAQDNRAWRLSFSLAEQGLSSCVGEKARKTYLAVKLLVKKKLKTVCPFLKTYHIKTIFFHYMETKTADYWNNTELETTINDLLG